MAIEFTLRRVDKQPFGTLEQVQSQLRELFPSVQFHWTGSGQAKIAMAAERGITFPPELAEALKDLPSLLEGYVEGNGFHLTLGLGHQDPVNCLYVTPRGDAPELSHGLAALEAYAGAELKVSGEE